ncbi:unnamed protein product [Ectocarpus sp. CCAP 1310/34]|nr:unnamed protein product [Ectocarpus sp. CCAP 1310/34]
MALASSSGGGGGWHDVGSEGSEGVSSTPPAADAAPAGAALAGTAAPVGRETGTQRNPVLVALEQVLGEMETRNRALFQQQLVAAGSQTAVSPPAEPESTSSGATSSAESKTCQWFDQTPLRPSASTGEGVRVESIAPTSLVELIHGGWLSADRARLGGGGAGTTGSTDFGTGQACVSELLGKFLGLVVDDGGGGATSPGGVGGRRSGGTHSSSFCGLAQAFRGTLCARTLCVECERDRTAREDFTELTLPPLLPPQHAPPLTAQRAIPAAENDGGPSLRGRHRTIQTLIDGVFERESLAGNNKVWCEACRQWTEAERRSSVHSPPGLLALHVRPGTRKRSSPCLYPKALARASGGAPDSVVGDVRRGADGRLPAGSREEAIERTLVVRKAARCQFHGGGVNSSSSGSSSSSSSSVDSCTGQLCDSGDIFYDLIGAILHQGQTLASGHYTFAINAAAGDWASFLAQQQQQQQQQADRDNRALVQQGPPGATAAGSTYGKPDFALFDDATVRWLSLEEERAVLRGDGGGFGDPFLVFYARRP